MAFARLEHSPGAAPISDINMTPLIDVMLVLLVIFIITAPLLVSAIRLDLPSTAAANSATVAKSVTLSVDASGQIYWQDRPVTPAQLTHQLRAAQAADPATELQLRADQAVPYGRILEIMAAAHQAGLQHLGFVAMARTSGATLKP